MLLENLAHYLEGQNIGTGGEDLFIGFLGDSVDGTNDNVVMIDQTGGATPDIDLPITKNTVQIMVRDRNFENGMTKAKKIFDLLHNAHDGFILEVGGVNVMRIFAINVPQYVGRDEQERDLFTCTFVFQLRNIAEEEVVAYLTTENGDYIVTENGDYLVLN